MVTENINIDVRPGGIPIVIHVTQYEVGLRKFVFTPYTSNGTQTVVAGSATLEGTKPDGYAFQQACQMIDGVITYTLQEQLCAVEGRVWSRLVIRDTDGGMIGYTAIVWVVGCAGVKDDAVMSDSDISAIRQFLDEFGDIDAYRGALNGALAAVGGPLVAATASAMTDTTKVYVYTGSESGYTEGHWYYWNGSAWTDGGVYQSTGINTDKTLTVEDMAADAKATGDAVAELKNDLDENVSDLKSDISELDSAVFKAIRQNLITKSNIRNGASSGANSIVVDKDNLTLTWDLTLSINTDTSAITLSTVPLTLDTSKEYFFYAKISALSNNTISNGAIGVQWQKDGQTPQYIGVAEQLYFSPTMSGIICSTFVPSKDNGYLRFIFNGMTTATKRINLFVDKLVFCEMPASVNVSEMEDAIASLDNPVLDIRVEKNPCPIVDLTDITTELRMGGLLITKGHLTQGTYNSAGAVVSSSTRIRTTGFIPVEKGGAIRFTPGAITSNISYGKFNTNKGFITDGPGWGNSDISIDWDGYVILVFKNSTNTTFAPSDYDATTIIMSSVENKAATVAEIAQTENPMNPLLFDLMCFRKGSVISGTEHLTQYEKPRFINNQFADLNAVSATGTTGYIAFLFNEINQPNVLTSGESIDYYAIVKTNKPLTFKPRLSSSTTWAPIYNVAGADVIHFSVGYNCVKMHFTYDHTGSSADDNYKYMVFEGNNVFTDLEAEFVFVKGETFLGWVKTLQAAEEEYSTDLLFWGDSLTAGAGGGDTSFPKVCSETLGLSRLNCGVGGENANTISARQGGNNIIIPAGAVNGNYPISDGFADLFGGVVKPLLQGDGAGSAKKITINGIECDLANSSGNYVISGYTGGATSVPSIGTFRGCGYTGKVVIIFVGQNGATFTGLSDYNARLAIIDSMIAHIGHNRYVILGLSTGTNTSREADDNAMLAKYGNKFLPTRKLLVEQGMAIAGLTPTSQDQTDIAVGTVPSSLRSDSIHLNASGYTALGKIVATKIKSLGYLT